MINEPLAPWAFQPPANLEENLNELYSMVERFKAGEISEVQFRAFRVPMGVYEQRESGTYMLRVRFPAGGALPHQLKRLAEVSASFGNGILHVTTRQDIQVHRVPLDALFPALLSLAEAGLSTKGGGGNTVRNITACYDSGICLHEVFDVAPFAIAMTEQFMADPVSFQLPRKYKIAFSACPRDCAGATVNDVGFIARHQGGNDGFAVYAGGGMGAQSCVAHLLHEFVPASEAFLVAEAIKRVFDKNGDRKNKHLARLRFLVERTGFNVFRELYEKELIALRASAPAPLITRPYPHRPPAGENGIVPPVFNGSVAWSRWFKTNVTPQKQPGFFMVHIPLTLGDLEAGKLGALAEVIEAHGEGMLCATPAQNGVMRWIAQSELPAVHEKLDALGLAEPTAPILRNLVACAGASTCRLGICLSRGLAKAITQALGNNHLDLERIGDLKLHVSGCPNSCGRHPVGDIGLSGAARRVEGRLVPHYTVHLGGRVAEGLTRLGVNSGILPARNAPRFLQDFLGAFLQSPDAPDFHRFLDHGGRKIAADLLARYRLVPAFETDKSFYFDWDAEIPFSLAGRGPGECSAGVFDLIEVDLGSAREALNANRLYASTALAARSLLITRGEQPKTDQEAFALFQKHFLAEGLVDPRLGSLIAAAVRSASTPKPEQVFEAAPADVAALVTAVRLLYENMDASLRFKPVALSKPPEAVTETASAAVHDFRGVACPLNYVKTKMALGKLQKGQSLLILLDEPGAKNVPESAAKDGYEVVEVKQNGDHWQVHIRQG